ncbi:MAG: YbhB/YbcL family Raf kinase inhibitor-like protein [Gammaproteobacteria bacterium]|nr:YbhB/YbcL family Raf kinase inhibitor-like protein [Gammaproteobacteria bacterium]
MPLILKSGVFEQGGEIPTKYTCKGDDISPPLNWQGVPENTHSLVLIIDDPDAPDPKSPKTIWVHWVLYNIPPDISRLAEHITSTTLPSGASEGINDWRNRGYGGPCPPIGRHRYFHKLYALDSVLTGLKDPDKTTVEKAMQGHIITQTELIGTYKK